MSKKDLFDDTTMTFGEHLECCSVIICGGPFIGLVIGYALSRFIFQCET